MRILLVEDSDDDAALLSHHLNRLGVELAIKRVDTPDALREALATAQWDVVISDYRMPQFSGLAALNLVREYSGDLPFIIVSATIGEDIAVESMRAGANDYVMKDNLARLLPAIKRELHEARARAKSRATHEAQQEKLDYLAYYDSVTGLANRTLFCERLVQLLRAAGRVSRMIAIVVLEIDRFKTINDTLGHQLGDALLKQTAVRLLRYHDEQVQIARVNNDRFAMALPQVNNEGDVARILEGQLADCFAAPFSLEGTPQRATVTAGIALFPADGDNAELLLKNAEAALGKARASGDKYLFCTEEMMARIAEKLAMESRLRKALENDEFLLYYQPKVNTQTRRIVALEALIRWQSPETGLVSPTQFIPLLEETGMILEVGAWVLRRAVRDHRQWQEQGWLAPRIAVNVSVVQLRSKDFVDVVREAILSGTVAPGIDLEITESLIMEDIQGSFEKLTAIRDMGLGIAIDDFGMGHSSLGYLVRLPVQMLKIDISFVRAMVNDPDTRTLVATIIGLAHSLRLSVVAEGVESEQQASALRELGCDELQGYLFGRPMPHAEMTALLRD